MADAVSGVNQGIINYFKNMQLVSMLEWLVFGIIIISAFFGFYIWLKNRKIYNKIIVVNEIVNGEFIETYKDFGKSVKLGSGGFEIIYLKKLKTWKLAQGARTGRNRYDFYIMPDGYWYPARKYANVFTLNQTGGLIPIVTTNASMRSQYTALEKQIDSLHAKKTDFWQQYGNWILSIAFILISGIMLYLCYQQFSQAMSSLSGLVDKLSILVDRVNSLIANTQGSAGSGGLIKS